MDGVDLQIAGAGLLRGGEVLLQTGDAVAGGAWTRFGAIVSAGPGALCVRGALDDPAVAGAEEAALVLLALDASGSVLAQTPLALEGHDLAGLGAVVDLPVARHGFASDASGAAVHAARFASGGAVVANGVALARDGEPSPVPGFAWSSLAQAAVDRNASGSVAFQGDLAPYGRAIVRDGELVVKAGDRLPAILPYVLTELGRGVRLGANGEALWQGFFDHPDRGWAAGCSATACSWSTEARTWAAAW